MTNFTTKPREDFYESELAASIVAGDTTIAVATAPQFALSSGSCYASIDPDGTPEIIEVTGISGTTLTVTRGIALYDGGGSSARAHAGGTKVIFSNNWKLFDDLETAVNSKLDQTGGTVASFSLAVTGSDWRVRKDGNDMKLRDDNQAEVTLSQLASLSGVNDKVKVSSNDTTENYLDSKVTGGDGITVTETNDGSNETLDIDVDLAASNDLLKFTAGELDTNLTATKAQLDEAGTFFGSTDLSAAEAEQLSDGSNADVLHVHEYNKRLTTATSDNTISNTTTETNILSFTVPANALGTADIVQMRVYISDLDIGSGDQITFRVKYGATTMGSAIIQSTTGTSSNWKGYIDATVYGAGTTSSQDGYLLVQVDDAQNDLVSTTSNTVNVASTLSATEDSTGALTMSLTAQWNDAIAGNSITVPNAYAMLITTP